MPVRALPSFLLLALAVGCAPDEAPVAEPSEADRLLARVTETAVADAFARLDALDYTATLETTTGDSTTALAVRSEGGTVRAAGGAAAEEPPRPRDPIGPALPAEPPFVDPASRDQYRRTVVGDTVVAGRRLRLVEAVLTDAEAEQQVRRVRAAVEPETARPVVVEVERAADSAVYTESSRVRVALAPGPGGAWLPRRVTTDTRTDVPLADPVRVRTEWTVRVEGA